MDTNPYAPPASADLPPQQRFPNPHVPADRRRVLGAGVTLIVLGGLQLLGGIALAAGGLDVPLASVLGLVTAGEGVLNLVLGILTLRNSYAAAVTGLVLSILGLLGTLLSFNLIGIIIRGVVVGLIAGGVSALRNVNLRIAVATQENPLVAYYHYFVPLLTRVMAADGHLDLRERQKIVEVCNGMSISAYEQRRLIERASAPQAFDAAEVTRRYLEAARQVGLPSPERQLLIAAVAVAGADGVLAEAEERLIRDMGKTMAVSSGEIDALIAQQQLSMDELTPVLARRLLNVSPNQPFEQITASYQRLAGDLQKQSFSHLGAKLGEIAERRRQVLDRAYALLQQRAA